MKKCTYCGKEYPDETTACLLDGEPLKVMIPKSVPPPPTNLEAEDTPKKRRSGGALQVVGFTVLAVGAFLTAATVAQMVMGMGGDGAHLVVGGVIVVVGLVMATRK